VGSRGGAARRSTRSLISKEIAPSTRQKAWNAQEDKNLQRTHGITARVPTMCQMTFSWMDLIGLPSWQHMPGSQPATLTLCIHPMQTLHWAHPSFQEPLLFSCRELFVAWCAPHAAGAAGDEKVSFQHNENEETFDEVHRTRVGKRWGTTEQRWRDQNMYLRTPRNLPNRATGRRNVAGASDCFACHSREQHYSTQELLTLPRAPS